MSLKKGHAFLIGIIFLTAFSAGAWALEGAYLALGSSILTACVAMVGLFFGGNVADNVQKGLNYRPELDKASQAKVDRDQP